MRRFSTSLALCATLALTGFAGAVRAELPRPVDFDLTYFITDEHGQRARQMGEADHANYANRARCQCGQQIELELGARLDAEESSERFETFLGTMCDVAETSLAGAYRRCGKLSSTLGASINHRGIAAAFHPAFLGHGVASLAVSRNVNGPDTVLAGACEGEGSAGLWVCKPGENNIPGCQQDEWFLSPESALSTVSGIDALQYDFEPPVARPSDLSAEPGNGAVLLSWSMPSSGDIAGLRVLCEEAGTGLAPGLGLPTPDLTAVPDDTHYLTAHNLCGDQPFSTIQVAAPPSPAPDTCGDGVVGPGEACDDGEDNGPDGLCDPACQLRVSPELHRLDWTHLCSEHLSFTDDSVVIGGLDNGTTYNFVLVAHDAAGNPRALAQVVSATPDASLPDLLPAEDGCGCSASPSGHVLSGMFLFALALVRPGRRRRG